MEKLFLDPVHGFIAVDEDWLVALVDSPEFQRLRRIRQLGVSSGTYHGAEHSRFGHSLGAFHVMKSVLNQLAHVRVSLSEADRRAALAAALLHDIGHGPFSHALEHVLTPGIGHERWGEAIITGPTRVNAVLSAVDPGLPARVADLIQGRHETVWLRQLVAGQLDVDRFDYLLRDSLYTGTGYGRFDLERIIHTMRVVDGRLGVQVKGLHAAEEYMLARHFMYWRVYLHKTIRAQERMLRAAVTRARLLWSRGEEVALPPSLSRLWSLQAQEQGAGGGEPAGTRERIERLLEAYLDLDDADVMVSLKMWRESRDPVLSDMSRRLLSRDLLKPLFRHAVEAIDPELWELARRLTAEAGWDPDYYCLLDAPANAHGYPGLADGFPAGGPEAGVTASDPRAAAEGALPGQGDGRSGAGAEGKGAGEEPILIINADGVAVDLASLSPLIVSLGDERRRVLNVYLPAPVRDALRAAIYS